MIHNKTPLPLAFAQEYIKSMDETKPMSLYAKKFTKLSKSDAAKLMPDLRALNNLKLREETIVKIIDFCPQDAEDLNKIVLDVSLTEEESAAIVALVKKY